jgi:hypothetical protein
VEVTVTAWVATIAVIIVLLGVDHPEVEDNALVRITRRVGLRARFFLVQGLLDRRSGGGP